MKEDFNYICRRILVISNTTTNGLIVEDCGKYHPKLEGFFLKLPHDKFDSVRDYLIKIYPKYESDIMKAFKNGDEKRIKHRLSVLVSDNNMSFTEFLINGFGGVDGMLGFLHKDKKAKMQQKQEPMRRTSSREEKYDGPCEDLPYDDYEEKPTIRKSSVRRRISDEPDYMDSVDDYNPDNDDYLDSIDEPVREGVDDFDDDETDYIDNPRAGSPREVKKLQMEKIELENKIVDLTADLENMSSEKENIETEVESLKSFLDDKTKEVNELKEKLAEKENTVDNSEELDKTKEELENIKEEFDKLKESINAIKTENETLKSNLEKEKNKPVIQEIDGFVKPRVMSENELEEILGNLINRVSDYDFKNAVIATCLDYDGRDETIALCKLAGDISDKVSEMGLWR